MFDPDHVPFYNWLTLLVSKEYQIKAQCYLTFKKQFDLINQAAHAPCQTALLLLYLSLIIPG